MVKGNKLKIDILGIFMIYKAINVKKFKDS